MENKTTQLNEKEEKEIVDFGVACLIAVVVPIIITIVAGAILDALLESILLLFFMLPLRENAGGFHFKSRQMCSVISVHIFVALILAIKFWVAHRYLDMTVYVIASIPIVFLVPVGNKNRFLDIVEKEKYGNRAKTIWLMETILFFVLWSIDLPRWYIIILLAVSGTALLVLIGFVQEKLGYGDREENV